MRKVLIGALVALALSVPAHADHVLRGGFAWDTAINPEIRTIVVHDEVVRGIPPQHRRRWRRQRDLALRAWERSGRFAFVVRGRPYRECKQPPPVRRGVIRLCVRGKNTGGAWRQEDGSAHSGWVSIASPRPYPPRGTLCHEFGHALGLEHRPGYPGAGPGNPPIPGNDPTCMGNSRRHINPDAHDFDMLRELNP